MQPLAEFEAGLEPGMFLQHVRASPCGDRKETITM
jgi:hypothetical protein